MCIALDALAARMPSAMRSALLRRKIKARCDRSNVSSVAAFCGNGRKVSITTRLLQRGRKGAGENADSRRRRSSRDYQEILRVEAATRRTARSGGVSGMLHRTTVRRADHIEDTVDSLVRNRGRI